MNYQEIAVNTSTLQNDINEMQNALDKVKKRTERMFNEIMALEGMWEGQAHEAFERQFLIDVQNMQNLCSTINDLIGCMQYADKEYISCENSVHSIINSIKI